MLRTGRGCGLPPYRGASCCAPVPWPPVGEWCMIAETIPSDLAPTVTNPDSVGEPPHPVYGEYYHHQEVLHAQLPEKSGASRWFWKWSSWEPPAHRKVEVCGPSKL